MRSEAFQILNLKTNISKNLGAKPPRATCHVEELGEDEDDGRKMLGDGVKDRKATYYGVSI